MGEGGRGGRGEEIGRGREGVRERVRERERERESKERGRETFIFTTPPLSSPQHHVCDRCKGWQYH